MPERDRTLLHGAGLGVRRALMAPLQVRFGDLPVAFMEAAPENWIGVGGAAGRRFRAFTERYPFVCHGLSLSLGGPAPLDEQLLRQVRAFLEQHGMHGYSEHLSYCSDDGQLYELLPIPFTEEAVQHVAARIRRSQDILGRRIAVENASLYATPGQQMDELEFINAVLREADCELLLDVNNVYVNSVNQGYDPAEFIRRLPGERIAYLHIAGHHREADELLVDTHGTAVIEPVWRLLQESYRCFGVLPTLLERDSDFPPLAELLDEVTRIAALQSRHAALAGARTGSA